MCFCSELACVKCSKTNNFSVERGALAQSPEGRPGGMRKPGGRAQEGTGTIKKNVEDFHEISAPSVAKHFSVKA